MKTTDIHGRPIVNKHQLEILAKEEAEFDALDALDDHWDDVDVDGPSPSRSR